ncbi:3alpha(or 20beta)-hydroxysteroid dehydrogenase [Bacillus niacini]|uniref:3alpha(Or 20beta)-hydroxysteroid dehydrogenase n=1 Tax=Neobacillus niacini TaxID=86668 RepID=A0A852TIA8_9BACI|nr:glucose 1-dehydrogenase [Neobacillus niacini]NYE07921.1 3alpha(or 20beta)-hydroxysteroid dehydrogenase [Neobacillus niacini]
MGKFDGKVVLITGGARGMGAAHAQAFVKEGAKVAISDILVEEGEKLAAELGEQVKFYQHDVTNQAEWEAVVDDIENTFGPIHVLVNNAGIVLMKSILDMLEEEYRKVIDINQVSVFLGMKSVLPSMLKTKDGSIINISSLAGFRGSSHGSVAYSASKFALRGMTKAVALEMAREGIRVNTVHPGLILTPMTVQKGAEEIIEHLSKEIPMQRAAQPEEVTKLVMFLASSDSSFSTGSEYILDGGQLAKL